MRKILTLLAALVSACGLAVVTSGNASALGGETLGCRVIAGTPYYQDCYNPGPSDTYYVVNFLVQNETGASTYTWYISGAPSGSSIADGCTSTANQCAVSVPRTGGDVYVSVVLTQGASSETLSSHADIEDYCGPVLC
ncbi:MAG: hypothetical protein M3Y42_18775 [Actinomycetota bacterium]|nr:hypothetical protein [Actinomycetota bacterium]MDQ2958990.1 hypothetical protein [Actinomycetota bacterium]